MAKAARWPIAELFAQLTASLFRHALEITETITQCTLLVRVKIAEPFEALTDLRLLFRTALAPFLRPLLCLGTLVWRHALPAFGAAQQVALTLGRQPAPVLFERGQQLALLITQLIPGKPVLCQGPQRQQRQDNKD